ncbi:hypothetical protein QAD02_020737 [Eretmocerus hayati]|uniref:Uncharacterized protein n=1 Tax=Eretmocerus hayati TaxID=131215 RepID=A0ACC2PNQ9_9HYME|nr:hypothetical protein QAD02_020737 [Eretmocerus hayati]
MCSSSIVYTKNSKVVIAISSSIGILSDLGCFLFAAVRVKKTSLEMSETSYFECVEKLQGCIPFTWCAEKDGCIEALSGHKAVNNDLAFLTMGEGGRVDCDRAGAKHTLFGSVLGALGGHNQFARGPLPRNICRVPGVTIELLVHISAITKQCIDFKVIRASLIRDSVAAFK